MSGRFPSDLFLIGGFGRDFLDLFNLFRATLLLLDRAFRPDGACLLSLFTQSQLHSLGFPAALSA
jgi:hypothetical protein